MSCLARPMLYCMVLSPYRADGGNSRPAVSPRRECGACAGDSVHLPRLLHSHPVFDCQESVSGECGEALTLGSLSVSRSVSLFLSISVFLCLCIAVHLSLSVSVTLCLSMCLTLYVPVCLCHSASLCRCISLLCRSFPLPLCFFMPLYFCLCLYLSISLSLSVSLSLSLFILSPFCSPTHKHTLLHIHAVYISSFLYFPLVLGVSFSLLSLSLSLFLT